MLFVPKIFGRNPPLPSYYYDYYKYNYDYYDYYNYYYDYYYYYDYDNCDYYYEDYCCG